MLYTKDGWLNFEYIFKKNAWLNVIIGGRQIGKTYGVLQGMLQHNIKHILLRRTTEELKMICSKIELNPYNAFLPEFSTSIFTGGICTIDDYIIDEKNKIIRTDNRGIALSLAQISHIRGFNGSIYSDMIFDEFIPERSVIVRKTEGDAFLNAYTTINGNRELAGKAPLRVWLLANTNRIDSPILDALNLTDNILYMRRKNKEELFLENGIYIAQPKSEKIIAARQETALNNQISKNSFYYEMSLKNEFAYDKSNFIKNRSIKGYKPIFTFDKKITCFETSEGYYFCKGTFSKINYDDTSTDIERLVRSYGILLSYYYAELIEFSDLKTLSIFKRIFNAE